jgi:pimeloyl-ACP methyl ester carboxylesterase
LAGTDFSWEKRTGQKVSYWQAKRRFLLTQQVSQSRWEVGLRYFVRGFARKKESRGSYKREVLSRIKGAELEIITDCGHLMPIDQPAQLADAIRTFVLD